MRSKPPRFFLNLVATAVPAVVSPCETPAQRSGAVEELLSISSNGPADTSVFDLRGAEYAADEIVALIDADKRAWLHE